MRFTSVLKVSVSKELTNDHVHKQNHIVGHLFKTQQIVNTYM